MKDKKPKLLIVSALLCGLIGLWLTTCSLVARSIEMASWAIWFWCLAGAFWLVPKWARIILQFAVSLFLVRISFKLGILIFCSRHGLYLGKDLPVGQSDVMHYTLSYFLPSLFIWALVLTIMNARPVKSFFKS